MTVPAPAVATRTLLADDFDGTPEGVRDAIAAVQSGLAPLAPEEEERFSVELVLAEVLNNVVEHAFDRLPGEVFRLSMAASGKGVHFAVRDRGHPMPEGGMPIGDAPSIPAATEDLPEGGFGWFLIRQLVRDLRYSRVGGENHLSFRIVVGQFAEA